MAKATAYVQQLQSVIEINSDEADVSDFSSPNANLSSPNANGLVIDAVVIASPNANAVVSPPNAQLNSNNSHREKNDDRDRVKVSLSQKRPLGDASKINITDSTTASSVSNNLNQFYQFQKTNSQLSALHRLQVLN